MRALVFEGGPETAATVFDAQSLQGADLGKEAWLQSRVFEHPELLPLEELDPGSGGVAPLCRELRLPRPQGPVYLDMLGVTRRGRLVLVECKLWRNPQARREVIGQILEYAALLKRFSYGDLSTEVAQRRKLTGANPIWTLAAERLGLTNEAAFVDAVSASLMRGEFDLLVVGDGIRSEIEAVRGYLETVAGLRTRLGLVELRALWSSDGRLALMPQLALRTQVIEHRLFDLAVETSVVAAPNPARAIVEAEGRPVEPAAPSGPNRAFWQRFIETVRFDHPDQAGATHGGENWVRLALPRPFTHATAYRSTSKARYGRIGLFVNLKGEAGAQVFSSLQQDHELAQSMFDQPILLSWDESKDGGLFGVDLYMNEPLDEDQQLAWLTRTANNFISFLRPRLIVAESV